jgi:hypothetical protein
MESICVRIHPQREGTRILATSHAATPLLKARLAAEPASRLALPALLEALSLWQGKLVRAVLVVDALASPYESSIYRDMFPDFGNGRHYSLEYVQLRRPPRRRDALAGMGDFRDLRLVNGDSFR